MSIYHHLGSVLISIPVLVGLVGGGQVFAAPKNQDPNTSLATTPNWQITVDGTATSVTWQDYAPNPRFAIYDNDTTDVDADDLVLDKETGLVWQRVPLTTIITPVYWSDALINANSFHAANRAGWRVPLHEELASLVDPSQESPALPVGHPFIDIEAETCYWTGSVLEYDETKAWAVCIGTNGGGVVLNKAIYGGKAKVWLVHGN
jgi:hypothetical protein